MDKTPLWEEVWNEDTVVSVVLEEAVVSISVVLLLLDGIPVACTCIISKLP